MAKKQEVNLTEKDFEKIPERGKHPNQKLKAYLVLQHLMRETDENHLLGATEIAELIETDGIHAERRGIYRDIEEINLISLMMEEGCSIEEAAEMLAEDEELKLIAYRRSKTKSGYYVRRRHYELDDIRLLAECINSSRFINQGQADRLSSVLCDLVSKHEAKKIATNAYHVGRVKTKNKSTLNNISKINAAMSTELDGARHTPEKISFQYLKYSIDDVNNQVERRHGERYTVSPFQLLINEGNYYLLAYSGNKIMTYRVDRMRDVKGTGEPREGNTEFKKIDMRTYTQRVFSMFSGEEQLVQIRFINPLLDAVIDRFGTDSKVVQYVKDGDHHFVMSAKLAVSDQFFGWLLGFGRKAKLIGGDAVLEQFKAYLDKVHEMYKS
ncbi:MAG: WYL domain-containing protein [Bacteroidaceae bacterium]|nr:WYL domain-containing protein [Bacteroidaceae bacterium]